MKINKDKIESNNFDFRTEQGKLIINQVKAQLVSNRHRFKNHIVLFKQWNFHGASEFYIYRKKDFVLDFSSKHYGYSQKTSQKFISDTIYADGCNDINRIVLGDIRSETMKQLEFSGNFLKDLDNIHSELGKLKEDENLIYQEFFIVGGEKLMRDTRGRVKSRWNPDWQNLEEGEIVVCDYFSRDGKLIPFTYNTSTKADGRADSPAGGGISCEILFREGEIEYTEESFK